MFQSPTQPNAFGPATILSTAQANNVKSVLQSQEDELTSNLPVGTPTPTTSPTALFAKYIDTGDTIFKDAASHALGALTTAAQTIPSMLGQASGSVTKLVPPNILSSTVEADNTYSKLNPPKSTTPQAPQPKPTFAQMSYPEQQAILDRTANSIAANETSIVKGDKYSSSQYSGNPAYGRALGKYRVTEGELQAYAPKFIGQSVTPAQFLANPTLQDNYMKNKAKYYLDKGYSPEQVADIHNKGVQHEGDPGSATYQSPAYVNSFDSTFNE